MSDEHASTPPAETSASPGDADVIVGPVNAAFNPLAPEDIMPAEPPSEETPPQEAQPGDEGASPPPLQPAPRAQSILWGCLRDILLVLAAVILASAFIFAILYSINGTLLLNDREKTTQLTLEQVRLEEQIADLQAKLSAQEGAIRAVDDRLNALQAQSDAIEQAAEVARQRVGELEAAQQRVEEDVVALDERMAGLEGEVQGIQEDIADFERVAERFTPFVEGLTRLIAEVVGEGPQSQVETTPEPTTPVPETTSTITSTLSLTQTVTITLTATITPTLSVTPTPESRALRLFPPTAPLPAPAFDRGVIYGLVWRDADANGQPDAGEKPIAGAFVTLKSASGRQLLHMVTGVDGRYTFINVPPNAYQVVLHPTPDQSPTTEMEFMVRVEGGDRIEVNFGIR
ncbi:MAG TPA: hypothetical protein EYP25_08980 [Anaerolineae bacterium]|nr:hypothetical protein [Anaerolineae bacterium]